MNQGVIVKFNSDKGWGFIRSENFESELFFHFSNCAESSDIKVGQQIQFLPKQSNKGLAAENITILETQFSPYRRSALWLVSISVK